MRNLVFLLLLGFSTPGFAVFDDANASRVTQQGSKGENRVIVLSWDGMRHDFPDRGHYPGLMRMQEEGVRATSLKPVYPSSTFPGHVSLATGVDPNIHGILDNQFFDRKEGLYSYSSDAKWIQAEPIWSAAERQGIKTATYFWVGSDTDWQGEGTSYRIAPFDATRTEAEKVTQIITWLDLPKAEQPRLIMSYWAGADSVGHAKGPDAPEIATQIANQDEQLQRLLQAIDNRNLWPTTTLIIVSDHGMTNINQSVEVKTAIEKSGYKVRIVGRGTVQHLFLDNLADKPRVLALLQKQPHISIFTGGDIPASLTHPTRTGDIVITTEPPYTLNRPSGFLEKLVDFLSPYLGWHTGSHGYSPDLPDMGGIFLAMGRGVKAHKNLGEVSQLQLVPTIAKLLSIQPPPKAGAAAIELDETI